MFCAKSAKRPVAVQDVAIPVARVADTVRLAARTSSPCSSPHLWHRLPCWASTPLSPPGFQQIGGKYVERNVAVLIVGAGYLHAVDQRIVIAFVHAADNGILPVATAIAHDRHAGHALKNIAHGDVGKQFDGLGNQ